MSTEASVIYAEQDNAIVSADGLVTVAAIIETEISETIVIDSDVGLTDAEPEDTVLIVTEAADTPVIVSDDAAVNVIESIETGPQGAPGGGVGAIVSTPNDGEIHLTPKTSSSGAEGTMFYSSADDHVYVAVE